jgi:hypothetical protein
VSHRKPDADAPACNDGMFAAQLEIHVESLLLIYAFPLAS